MTCGALSGTSGAVRAAVPPRLAAPRFAALALVGALAQSLVPASARAEASAPSPAPAPRAAEPGWPEALKRGTWVAGLGGHISSSGDRWQVGRDPDPVRVGRVDSGLDVRSGIFLTRRFVVGVDFELNLRSQRIDYDDRSSSESEENVAAGPWFRVYLPTDRRWALFFEGSWGYQQTVSNLGTTGGGNRLYGLALQGGFGACYFFTESVAFDAALEVRGANLYGRAGDIRTHATREDLGVRVGFQLYLPEFVF